MSYIYNNKIAYSDSPNIDAFGRLRVSTITSILDVKHNLDKNPLIVDEVTGGTCSSIFNEEFARVRMSAGTSGYVIRQTKKHATYQPGKSQLFEASFSNFQIETDIIKRVGLFESTTAATYNSEFDGLFLESNGVTNQISFQLWRTGTLVYSSDTLSWDSGEIDPSTLDWSKTQLNEIRSSGGTGYFDMLCSQVSTEGPLNQGLYYTVTIPYTAETTLATSGVKYPFIGYRLNPNFPHASSKIDTASIISTSNDDHFITIEFNPTISIGRTWYDLPNTPFQYSFGTGGTETVTSSGFMVGAKVGKAASATQTELDIQDSIIEVGANINGTVDEMWVCLQSTSNNNAKFRGLINLRYYP